ncbi:methyltransferase family protein [Sphaerisporangium fuscum]|uniref:methyltransferase family protein n=1 Tax=Sphaerisporangium fuscum TaxID=2835868 RepID=UPI001BDCD640|nr:isoprenylcysteine carboxylmethyltransferase family protein [Sphaerisporangium fuscum]
MSAGTWWFLAGYAGLAGFFALEALTRNAGTASSLDASSDDRGTTLLIVVAYTVAACVTPFLRFLPWGSLPLLLAPAGLVVQVAGLSLRGWSMRTLGRFYSRTLRTEGDEHHAVQTGPYRLVRHPGYAGSLLIWTGFALTSRTALAVAAIAALLGWAYWRRIIAEERLLEQRLPGYSDYRARTGALIPFIGKRSGDRTRRPKR